MYPPPELPPPAQAECLLIQLTTARLQRGFPPVLQVFIAHAVLNTSSWRVKVDTDWVAQHGQTVWPSIEARAQPLTAPKAHPHLLTAVLGLT